MVFINTFLYFSVRKECYNLVKLLDSHGIYTVQLKAIVYMQRTWPVVGSVCCFSSYDLSMVNFLFVCFLNLFSWCPCFPWSPLAHTSFPPSLFRGVLWSLGKGFDGDIPFRAVCVPRSLFLPNGCWSLCLFPSAAGQKNFSDDGWIRSWSMILQNIIFIVKFSFFKTSITWFYSRSLGNPVSSSWSLNWRLLSMSSTLWGGD